MDHQRARKPLHAMDHSAARINGVRAVLLPVIRLSFCPLGEGVKPLFATTFGVRSAAFLGDASHQVGEPLTLLRAEIIPVHPTPVAKWIALETRIRLLALQDLLAVVFLVVFAVTAALHVQRAHQEGDQARNPHGCQLEPLRSKGRAQKLSRESNLSPAKRLFLQMGNQLPKGHPQKQYSWSALLVPRTEEA